MTASMLEETLRNKWHFIGTFVLVFFVTLVILASFGFVPFSAEGAQGQEAAVSNTSRTPGPEMPIRIVIKDAGVDASIENPVSTDIAVLDAALRNGAVRYPTSAKLNENGTVFLFGHSSYLPVVLNPAYKTFNDIQKLKRGSEIRVQSEGFEYVYTVAAVNMVDAGAALIDLSRGNAKKLVLSTCDSFGAKSERFVVEADFVGSVPVAS